MMPNYVRQRDSYGCGPVALVNALKWAGKDISFKRERKKYYDKCCVSPGSGANPIDLFRATMDEQEYIKVIFWGWGHPKKPRISQVEKHIRDGGAAILGYYYDRKEPDKNGFKIAGHYVFVDSISDTGKTFYVVNDSRSGPTRSYIRRNTFLSYLTKNRKHLNVYLISKRK